MVAEEAAQAGDPPADLDEIREDVLIGLGHQRPRIEVVDLVLDRIDAFEIGRDDDVEKRAQERGGRESADGRVGLDPIVEPPEELRRAFMGGDDEVAGDQDVDPADVARGVARLAEDPQVEVTAVDGDVWSRTQLAQRTDRRLTQLQSVVEGGDDLLFERSRGVDPQQLLVPETPLEGVVEVKPLVRPVAVEEAGARAIGSAAVSMATGLVRLGLVARRLRSRPRAAAGLRRPYAARVPASLACARSSSESTRPSESAVSEAGEKRRPSMYGVGFSRR